MKIAEFVSKNKIVAIIAAIVVVLVIIFVSYVFSSASGRIVPASFVEARVSASDQAAQLVSILSETTGRIGEVQERIGEYKYTQALEIVTEEAKKDGDIRNRAVQLALELEKMAKAIQNIRSDQAAQVALSATSKEAALIAQLLSYVNELQDLLVQLRLAVSNPRGGFENVNDSIADINKAADEINKLNEEYKAEMSRFDEIIADTEKEE